jgi:hypothetical protein
MGMRKGLRSSLRWALAAGYGLVSAFLLVWALNGFFYYPLVNDPAHLSILGHAPCGAVKRYVGYVLEDRDELFRSSSEKLTILSLLVQAQESGVRLCYDPKQVLPYLDRAVAGRYASGEEDGTLPQLAGSLLLARSDPGLMKAAFDRYRDKPEVVSDLCGRLWIESALAPQIAAVRQSYCPPPPAPPLEPVLTPEERRRQETFKRILEESRRGAL